ncbi:MAG: hypothetical protein ACREFQ_14895, partial [Stellaceae bacterium]
MTHEQNEEARVGPVLPQSLFKLSRHFIKPLSAGRDGDLPLSPYAWPILKSAAAFDQQTLLREIPRPAGDGERHAAQIAGPDKRLANEARAALC